MLLKIHPSNFEIVGFCESPNLEDLCNVAEKTNHEKQINSSNCANESLNDAKTQCKKSVEKVLVYEDLGSGALIELDNFGKNKSITVQNSIKAGIDIVSFSGDKLMGGPQAGIIVGKKEYIDRLKKNPLLRALRLDKHTIAAVRATLVSYLNEENAISELPTLAMISNSAANIKLKAELFMSKLKQTGICSHISIELLESDSYAGGGTLPTEIIPSYSVKISSSKLGASKIADSLLNNSARPVLVRTKDSAIFLDFRTIQDKEIDLLVDIFHDCISMYTDANKQVATKQTQQMEAMLNGK